MNTEKRSQLTPAQRLAIAFFATRIDEFLTRVSPEEIQKMCVIAGLDEAGFVAACKELMGLPPGDRARAMLQ